MANFLQGLCWNGALCVVTVPRCFVFFFSSWSSCDQLFLQVWRKLLFFQKHGVFFLDFKLHNYFHVFYLLLFILNFFGLDIWHFSYLATCGKLCGTHREPLSWFRTCAVVPYALIAALLTPCLGPWVPSLWPCGPDFWTFWRIKNSIFSPHDFWCQHVLTLAWGCQSAALLVLGVTLCLQQRLQACQKGHFWSKAFDL